MMKPKYNNILIDAVMHLGDLIHATTLIPLLKQQYPDARISYLVKPELVDLFKNIDNIEYVIPYKYKSKGDDFSVFRMAKEIKKYNFDLSISLDPRLRLSAMMCKWSDPFSKHVLIGRGLDHNSLETFKSTKKC